MWSRLQSNLSTNAARHQQVQAARVSQGELISLLGSECFYDHERRTLPSRRPVLDALGQPLH